MGDLLLDIGFALVRGASYLITDVLVDVCVRGLGALLLQLVGYRGDPHGWQPLVVGAGAWLALVAGLWVFIRQLAV